ncbi:MAG TPA: serine hydrolase domain-containing protein, partial [Candidatus Nitrosocosmicus sp.]
MLKIYLIIQLLILDLHLIAQKGIDSTLTLEKKFDNLLNSANETFNFNGEALILQRGKIILQKGYGWKNAKSKTLNQTNGIFQIGSNTKPFTAIAILKLQEEGKLSLNDPLKKYLPNYPNGNNITIENLLTHTSGIVSYDVEESDTIAWKPVSRNEILNYFKDKPLEFKPGSQFKYSNSGYFLLGMIIEKVTGGSYEKAI